MEWYVESHVMNCSTNKFAGLSYQQAMAPSRSDQRHCEPLTILLHELGSSSVHALAHILELDQNS
jgi:hypothetical protein